MNLAESRTQWLADKPRLAALGIYFPSVQRYLTDDEKRSNVMAMDAAGTLVTDPNSALPSMLTTTIDPEIIRAIFSPLDFGEILGERQAGNWTEDTRLFPIVESTGEVSSYGDFNNNGRAGINFNYPAFQSYLFQTIVKYGEREIDRVGLAKINLVSELGVASALLLNTFQNLTYAFGVSSLQNYGIINNLIALVNKLVAQTNGALNTKSPMKLTMSPQSEVAMTFTNSFGVSVADLMKKGYPNVTVKTAPQYGTQSATNQQGYSTAGNVMQLIADKIQGQTVAYAAYNEKLRAHKIIPGLSDWQQKQTSGSWGVPLRIPAAVSGMIGI